jgi:hypothetical protein
MDYATMDALADLQYAVNKGEEVLCTLPVQKRQIGGSAWSVFSWANPSAKWAILISRP